ncbi:hypothetical protein J3F83DRAFT_751655 [Trichoderma novae-zelandiae]
MCINESYGARTSIAADQRCNVRMRSAEETVRGHAMIPLYPLDSAVGVAAQQGKRGLGRARGESADARSNADGQTIRRRVGSWG